MEVSFPISENSEYVLNNLEKGTVYQVYLKAVSKRGTSDASNILTIRTEGECK